jgi:hypothetical protein
MRIQALFMLFVMVLCFFMPTQADPLPNPNRRGYRGRYRGGGGGGSPPIIIITEG